MVFNAGVLTELLLLFFRPSKAFFPAIFYFRVLSIVLLPHRKIPRGIHISQRPEEKSGTPLRVLRNQDGCCGVRRLSHHRLKPKQRQTKTATPEMNRCQKWGQEHLGQRLLHRAYEPACNLFPRLRQESFPKRFQAWI